jgi:hypothetical protein
MGKVHQRYFRLVGQAGPQLEWEIAIGCGERTDKLILKGLFCPLCRINTMLYCTVHLCLSNVTSHPTSINTCILNRDAIDKSGIMCPIRTNGRPAICTLHMCVDTTCRPSANVTFSGRVVWCLLITLAPSMTKIWVALESAMVTAVLSRNIAPAQSLFCRRADKKPYMNPWHK